MKMAKVLKKSFILPILGILAMIVGLTFIPKANAVSASYDIKTLTEMPAPTIAGSSGSYVDDGVLYYMSSGDTIGYKMDHTNTMFDFNFMPTTFAWPGWLSLSLKASACDRTQSSNLAQKGYSFALFPAGTIEIWKDGATLATVNQKFLTNTKYNIKIGAINEEDSVRLIMQVDGNEIINVLDETNAYTTGDWFNICGDGGCGAEFYTTKKIVIPKYYTYTLSTLAQFPTRAGSVLAEVDKYNNISIASSGSTVGFNQYLQNFSLEMKVNFSEFSWPANFYFSARTGGFDRVLSSNLTRKGYSFRISPTGSVSIYKESATIATGNCGAIATGKDYVIEFGTVDINKDSTYIFFAVNNKVCASVFDNDNPIQKYGLVNMNGDGNVACKISSSDTKVSPLRATKTEKDNYYEIKTYFVNPISYSKMTTSDFSERNLKAISLGDKTLFEIKANYYAKNQEEKIAPFEIEFEKNVLTIKLQKSLYLKSNDSLATLQSATISILKTSKNSGLICPSGFVLKQTYTTVIG